MRRSVSWFAVSVLLGYAAFARAGEKLPDQTQLADAKEDVAQALLAEAQGDNSTRSKRLTKAWLAAPDLAEANWHLARIRVADDWRPLAEIVSAAASDPDQVQYRALREKSATSPRALRDLARWCTKFGWHDRARLHYAQLLANPKAEAGQKSEAVEKLNLVQVNGAWLTKDEVQARQEEAKAVQESLAKWRPRLKTLQQVIDGDDFAKRDKAIAELAKLDDAAMIPALESFLLDGRADFQEQAVKKLASFQHYEATQALTRYAVLSDYSLSRDAAIAALKDRPQHEYVPLLLSGLVSPIKSQFQVVWADGKVNYVHSVLSQGPSGNLLLIAHRLALPFRTHQHTHKSDLKIVPVTEPAKTETSALNLGVSASGAARQQRLRAINDAANVETKVSLSNSQSRQSNRRLFDVLSATTNQTFEEPVQWWTWWQDYNGYKWPRPTKFLYRYSPIAYNVATSSNTITSGTAHPPRPGSCFLSGTPVRTEMGTVPIESIQPGDRVLSQDQDTGELAYQVVLTTTLRPPTKMLEIKAGGENIYTTLGHPFWVAGRGWQMAKQLKEGDLLHGLAGATPIESINAAGEHAAHNLVVDDDNTYFVGQSGLLVHDNEFRKPTRSIVPGLVRD
jgi:hypothetical protein